MGSESHPSKVIIVWSHDIWCAILLNDNIELHMSTLGSLVPEGPSCVFYAIRHQVYWGLTHTI